MNEPLTFRSMQTGEETEVCNFVVRVFNEFIAPSYSQEGVAEFLKYVRPDALALRSKKNHFVWLAEAQNDIVGAIEIRDNDHVSLLFVDGSFQRKGISRELLRRALEICRRNKPELREITVHASPNSVQIYERLGFRQTNSEQAVNGIRFTPMTLGLFGAKGANAY